MASLPPIKRDSVEDFPGQKDWIDKLLAPNNTFKSFIYNAFNNQLTRGENLLSQIVTNTVKTKPVWKLGASITIGPDTQFLPPYAELVSPLQAQVTMKAKPIGLVIYQCLEVATNAVVKRYGVTADWNYSNGIVTVYAISGLEPAKSYNISFELVGG